jgi:hypothetical protein
MPTCKVGRYMGSKMESITVAGLPLLSDMGTIAFRLVPVGGDLYDVTEGTSTGTAPGAPSLSITGRIQCPSMSPQVLTLTGGSEYDMITGTMTATYDLAASSFEGTQSYSAPSVQLNATGSWSANWLGP